jgi:hypothetical protein
MMTLSEIGQELGITRERVRQIEAGALRKLRPPCYGGREWHAMDTEEKTNALLSHQKKVAVGPESALLTFLLMGKKHNNHTNKYEYQMSVESKIECPNCATEIDLSKAMSHGLREQYAAEFNAKLETERSRITADAEKSAGTKLGTRLKDLESQAKEHEKIISEVGEKELALLNEKRRLQEERRNIDLNVALKLDAEREKVVFKMAEGLEEIAERDRLKLAEKDQLIGGLQKQINELKQSVEQGSMQLQGETLEVQLEEELRAAFCHDEITEIKKGQLGADALQVVRTNQGVDFRQNINGLVESFILLQKQLESERRSLQKQWKEREKQLKNAIECTVSIYGEIQGIAGREALPEIKTLELPGG